MPLVDVIDLDDDEWYVKVDVIDLSSDEDSVKKDGNVEEEEEEQQQQDDDDNDNVAQSENLAEAATSSSNSAQDSTAATSLSMVDQCSTMSSSVAIKSIQPENQEFRARSDGAKDAIQPGNHELIALGDCVGEAMQSKHEGAITSSLREDKSMQSGTQVFVVVVDCTKEDRRSGNHKLIAAGDCVGEAMQSEREARVLSSMTEQAAPTSLLWTEQGATTSSLRDDKSMQSGNQVFVAAVDCAKEAIQSENIAKEMVGYPRIVGDGLDVCISYGGGHPHGEPGSSTVPFTISEVSTKHERHSGIGVKGAVGNAMGNTGFYNLHAQEKLEGDTEKDENCDFEEETETLSPQEKEKETSRFGKFYDMKEQKQVDTGYLCHRMQQMLYNGDSGISLMGNVRDRAASIGINVLDGEVLMSTYQECSKTFQGNTMCGKVSDNGSKRCMVEGCTNGAHGGTTLCIFHNSKPHIRCCAVIGCTKEARRSSQGRRGCCVNHGGGKRCKYDGCGKGAKGKTDYCVPHGGERRCKFLGCGTSKTCGKDLCSMHIPSLLSGNNSDHEMLPAPTPACQAKTAELSKGRFSHLVIGGRSHKKQNTDDYVNTRSFSVIETREENDRGFICLNNVPKAQNKEKDISRCRKFYDSEEKKPLDMGYLCDRMQQKLHNGDSGISVMGKVCDGAASVGTDVLDDEVLMSTYQECSKTFQGNTMDGKVHDSGSKGCTVQGCTNGVHGGTALCIFHNSRPHKRCCAVTGCTKTACEGSQGRTDHCVKHGGGKRCKYDGCGKGAQGNTDSCIAHGGGRRCKFQGCRKSAQGRCDYCIRHGGGRRCKFPGCSASATCGTDFCYKHRISLSSGSNFGREMLPAPAHETKNAEPSKRRNSHSVIGGRSQKRQNANDHVNTVAETGGK